MAELAVMRSSTGSVSSQSSEDIVRRPRPPDPLQLELTHWLDLHGVLDLSQHARANQDLTQDSSVFKVWTFHREKQAGKLEQRRQRPGLFDA